MDEEDKKKIGVHPSHDIRYEARYGFSDKWKCTKCGATIYSDGGIRDSIDESIYHLCKPRKIKP